MAELTLHDMLRWPPNPFLTLPDDPFDPTPWFGTFYKDVDLDAIDWADEMRKLPGQFTQLLCFPGSLDHRIIAQAVHELTEELFH
ncbi:hypothetical protein D2E60_23465 [Mycobacteroides abscessus]|uniref:hypothetical protein n=1 Tax=Mycobacteroides abscessus TaxID=36809 RepID=UPI0009A8C01F|nr:hypothetical protein [Mycobacteroides abscessus]RIS37746.1 hypothetical protein D2E60_23465 [Mycobacteroides abscessus]SLD72397.1 Uncharacterised protein [Mycobacteroides abscessus subsp. massiliense]